MIDARQPASNAPGSQLAAEDRSGRAGNGAVRKVRSVADSLARRLLAQEHRCATPRSELEWRLLAVSSGERWRYVCPECGRTHTATAPPEADLVSA